MAVNGDVEIQRNSPVASVLLAYVSGQINVLREQDPQVRQGVPDSVHLMRIATRRLRSVLATYRALLDADLVNHLREELKWLGLILGAERDAEVMCQRLNEMIVAESNRTDFESVSRQVDEKLAADVSAAHLAVLSAFDDERYLRLLDELDLLLTSPPLMDLATEPAKKVIPYLIKSDLKRLQRTVRTLKNISVGRESALHEVRKRAKRLRYAAESAELVGYKRASKLVSAAEDLQKILGDYHDSVVARDLLRRLDEQVAVGGANGFNFEHLIALEERKAERSEVQFHKAWRHFRHARFEA